MEVNTKSETFERFIEFMYTNEYSVPAPNIGLAFQGGVRGGFGSRAATMIKL